MSELELFRPDLSQDWPPEWGHVGFIIFEDQTDASVQRRLICLPVAQAHNGVPLGYIATPELGHLALSDLDEPTTAHMAREEEEGCTSDQTSETRVFRALLAMVESWQHPPWRTDTATSAGVQALRACLLPTVADFGKTRLPDEAVAVSRDAVKVWEHEDPSEEEKLSAIRQASSALSNRYLFVKSMRALGAETHEILEVCSELEDDLMNRLPNIRASEAGAHRTTVLPKCTAGSGCQVISHLSDGYCVAYRAAVMDLCDHETPDW